MISMETVMFTIIFMIISHSDFPFVSKKAVLGSLCRFKAKKMSRNPNEIILFCIRNQINTKKMYRTRKYLLCMIFYERRLRTRAKVHVKKKRIVVIFNAGYQTSSSSRVKKKTTNQKRTWESGMCNVYHWMHTASAFQWKIHLVVYICICKKDKVFHNSLALKAKALLLISGQSQRKKQFFNIEIPLCYFTYTFCSRDRLLCKCLHKYMCLKIIQTSSAY